MHDTVFPAAFSAAAPAGMSPSCCVDVPRVAVHLDKNKNRSMELKVVFGAHASSVVGAGGENGASSLSIKADIGPDDDDPMTMADNQMRISPGPDYASSVESRLPTEYVCEGQEDSPPSGCGGCC